MDSMFLPLFTPLNEGRSPDVHSIHAGSPGMVTYVGTDDISQHLKRAESAGGSIVMPQAEIMEGTVIGLFADPEGHVVGLLKEGSQ